MQFLEATPQPMRGLSVSTCEGTEESWGKSEEKAGFNVSYGDPLAWVFTVASLWG
jgi:hypothetical protein